MKWFQVGIVFSLLSISFVLSKPALAQTEQVFEQKNIEKVTLEPALQEVVIENEARTTVPIVLENTSSVEQRFNLRVVDFGSLDESGGVAFLGSGDPREYEAAKWMEIPVTDILVAPQSKTRVDVTIKNDDTFSPGGHYGAVLFENDTPDSHAEDKTRIAVRQVFSALVYVRKVGGEVFSFRLESKEYRKQLWRLPETVNLRFTNEGNVHVIPRGTVRISDPLGRTIKKATINQSSGLVLPNTARRFDERFIALASAWLPGQYSIRVEYRYDGKDTFEVSGEKYWYWPPVTTGILIVILGAFFALKHSHKKGRALLKKIFKKEEKKAL
jgi:hypothetical protein